MGLNHPKSFLTLANQTPPGRVPDGEKRQTQAWLGTGCSGEGGDLTCNTSCLNLKVHPGKKQLGYHREAAEVVEVVSNVATEGNG